MLCPLELAHFCGPPCPWGPGGTRADPGPPGVHRSRACPGPQPLMCLRREGSPRVPPWPAWCMEVGRAPHEPEDLALSVPQAASLWQPPRSRLGPSMQRPLTRMLWRLKTLCRCRGGVCSELTGDGYSIGLVSVGELAHRPSGTYSGEAKKHKAQGQGKKADN